MNDLLVKYRKKLKKELGNEWNIEEILDERVIVIKVKCTGTYCDSYDENSVDDANVIVINLQKATHFYTPEFEKQSVKTRAILTKLSGELMLDYNTQPRLKLSWYTIENIKKVNDNLVSFDIFYKEEKILKDIKWNGSNRKTLKLTLLDIMVANMEKDDKKNNKYILEFCKVLDNSEYYCKLKDLAKKVLNDD